MYVFKDASHAIPKGTLLAILISTLTYIAMAWMAGSCVLRDAAGAMATMAINGTLDVREQGSGIGNETEGCQPGECVYGLHNDMQVGH